VEEGVLAATPVPRRRRGLREWAVLSLTCWSLLGQGERCEVDPRFSTPAATLTTYWESLRTDDAEAVEECFADPRQALPFPGMLWFLPPSETVIVGAIRYSAGTCGTVVTTYELRFRPLGSTEEMSVVTGSELVRLHGEWRIARASGEVGMPEWRPIPRRVDI